MDALFLFKLLISFITGAAVIITVTTIAERVSPRWAGILSASPTIMLVGVIFITIANDVNAAAHAMIVVPSMTAAVMAFVLGFIFFAQKGILLGLVGAFSLWWAFAFIALILPESIWLQFAFFCCFYIVVAFSVSTYPSLRAPRVKASKLELTTRALLAGTAISTVLIATKLGGPLWGGIFTCFPAAISCTLYLMGRRHGPLFAKSIAKNMPHGTAGCCAFGIVFYLVAPQFSGWTGLAVGLGLGYLVAMSTSIFLSKLFSRLRPSLPAVQEV